MLPKGKIVRGTKIRTVVIRSFASKVVIKSIYRYSICGGSESPNSWHGTVHDYAGLRQNVPVDVS
jgi:hypothetical protein